MLKFVATARALDGILIALKLNSALKTGKVCISTQGAGWLRGSKDQRSPAFPVSGCAFRFHDGLISETP
jgi:hypothetical protein